MEEQYLAQQIRLKGWIQGSVLPMTRGLDAPDSSWGGYVVISQTCDVVHHDFQQEPHVELLPLHVADNHEGNRLYGKNPRVLQVDLDETRVEMFARERFFLDRKRLAKLDTDPKRKLEDPVLRMVCHWLAKRYIRPAFPDAFNERLMAKPHGAKIRKLLKTKGEVVVALWVKYSPASELPDHESYTTRIWVLMQKKDYDNPESRNQAQLLTENLEELLFEVPCLGLKDCSLRCESEVTLDNMRHFVPWDFDDLTHRDDPSREN